ncbi:MAG: hypothetical protein Q7U20_00995 [Caulobacter sp.]|nr:hypothetical protein [Caulobacter sp.]
MQVFTFFLCQPDGSAASFEARPFASDEDAVARSRALLGVHPSSSMVSVWDGERSVHKEWRCTAFRALPGFSRGPPLGQTHDVCEQCASHDCVAALGSKD